MDVIDWDESYDEVEFDSLVYTSGERDAAAAGMPLTRPGAVTRAPRPGPHLHWPFPWLRGALAVVAHPDDESFGLGALLAGLSARGTEVGVLSLTHGEASSLGRTGEDLGQRRATELKAAAERLGVSRLSLLDLPDGVLSRLPEAELDRQIEERLWVATLLVVFEPSGVTGHPDHRAATAAAERVAVKWGLHLLEWGVPPEVAFALNRQFGASFHGFVPASSYTLLRVDRSAQADAIACHQSQALHNKVLARRLELQGDRELVQWMPAVPIWRLSRRAP
jgi:LmbE family N-acetylglucosaminyl deacetylase